MVRLFTAIVPPDSIIGEICKIQSSLQKMVDGDVRWVKRTGLHLTLKFFGDVPESGIERIDGAAGGTVATELPLTFSFRELGAFPSTRRPRVLYLGMDGDLERLAAFQKKLDTALREAGFPAEERPFIPHLTLARLKALPDPRTLSLEIVKRGKYRTGQFTAAELVLFKSDLTPGGAIYTTLASYPFTGYTGAGYTGGQCIC
jgi:2'-5' RNA ligase